LERRSFYDGRIFIGGFFFVAVDFAVVLCVERAVLGVEVLRRHGQDEAILLAFEAGGIVAAVGVDHALGEGAGVHQFGERSCEVSVLLFETVLGAQNYAHVGEGGGFGVGAGGVAGELWLIDGGGSLSWSWSRSEHNSRDGDSANRGYGNPSSESCSHTKSSPQVNSGGISAPNPAAKPLFVVPLHVTPVISLRSRSLCSGRECRYALSYEPNPTGKPMKAAVARKPIIRLAVVESDPLRFVGFRALFDSEPEFELISASLAEISTLQSVDLILLGNRSGQNLFDVMASLKATRPDLRIIVTGSGVDEETILKAIASGAKGYVDEAASPAEFVQAIRIVSQGSVWAPRRVLSMFIERVSSSPGRIFPAGRVTFTDREKEVLEMLVAGRSNKEIGAQLGIEERTVKAHVAKLMRKVGVQNRIALSVHAITHSLVAAK